MKSKIDAADCTLIYWTIAIAVFALALRLAYQDGMLAFDGSFNNGSDSGKYISAARSIWLTGSMPETERLPLYVYFVAAMFKTIGTESLRAVVSVQACFDALSVLGIALAARAMARELVIPAALTAAIIPNFVVHSSYILTENIFLLFLTWGLCALLWAVKSRKTFGLVSLAGMMFGLTLLTRLTLAYLPLFLVPALIIALRIERGLPFARCIALSLVAPIVMAIVASPLLIYNYVHYGYLALSSEVGSHLLFWVYGCLATPWPCADRGRIVAMIAPIANEHVQLVAGKHANPFAVSALMQSFAIQRIFDLPLWQIAWGWSWGAFRNLMQTGFYQVLTQFNQPPNFFSAMHGTGVLDRIGEFVRINWNNPFMILWVISQFALVVSRAVQFLGALTGLTRPQFRGPTLLLIGLIVYVLALNGPVADPKYRIPMEPALLVLFAIGLTFNPLVLILRSWIAVHINRLTKQRLRSG
jgi:4-amino-4-deoxy-L-arabinose transferase-like glycosyltransferase